MTKKEFSFYILLLYIIILVLFVLIFFEMQELFVGLNVIFFADIMLK